MAFYPLYSIQISRNNSQTGPFSCELVRILESATIIKKLCKIFSQKYFINMNSSKNKIEIEATGVKRDDSWDPKKKIQILILLNIQFLHLLGNSVFELWSHKILLEGLLERKILYGI